MRVLCEHLRRSLARMMDPRTCLLQALPQARSHQLAVVAPAQEEYR